MNTVSQRLKCSNSRAVCKSASKDLDFARRVRSPNQMALLFGMEKVEHKPDAEEAAIAFHREHWVDTQLIQSKALLPDQKPWKLLAVSWYDEAVTKETCFSDTRAWSRFLIIGFNAIGHKKGFKANPRLPSLLGPVLVWRQFTKEAGEHAEAKDGSLTLDDVPEITCMINARMKAIHKASSKLVWDASCMNDSEPSKLPSVSWAKFCKLVGIQEPEWAKAFLDCIAAYFKCSKKPGLLLTSSVAPNSIHKDPYIFLVWMLSDDFRPEPPGMQMSDDPKKIQSWYLLHVMQNQCKPPRKHWKGLAEECMRDFEKFQTCKQLLLQKKGKPNIARLGPFNE